MLAKGMIEMQKKLSKVSVEYARTRALMFILLGKQYQVLYIVQCYSHI